MMSSSPAQRRRPTPIDARQSPMSTASAGFFSPVSVTQRRSSPLRGDKSVAFLPSMASLASSMVSVSPHRRRKIKRAKSTTLLTTKNGSRFFGKTQPTSTRLGASTAWCDAVRPGPQSYRPVSSIGTKMFDSLRPTAPSATFSRGPKPSYVDRNDAPGVGSYDTAAPGLGRQSLSHRRSAPTASFGTGYRSSASKMFAVWSQ